MIKIEPADKNDDTDSYKTNKETQRKLVKSIQMEIKQEHELILETDDEWLPSKIEDEQQEYYHQYQHNDSNDEGDVFILPSIKPVPEYEEYSARYIDKDDSTGSDHEHHLHHDIDENEDSKSIDNGMDNSGFMELIKNSSGYCSEERDTFLKWLCPNYIQRMCPICSNKFETYKTWSQHINSQYQDMIDGVQANFYINEENSRATCKLCSNQFNMDFQMLIHSLRHASQNAVKIFICNICDFESTNSINIQNHIIEQHPYIKPLFKKRKIETKKKDIYYCPLCPSKYQKCNDLFQHFLYNHKKEFWEKFVYECHICEEGKTKFIIDEEYFKHLLDEHKLKDLKLLNFRKLSENPAEHYYSCTKCFKIFTVMNLIKFLKHYLEHDTKSFGFCKYCSRKISFSNQSFYHVCPKMIKAAEEENTPSPSVSHIKQEKKKKLSNWQEFEDYIIHICPFCKTDFDTLQLWQMHLRKLHQFDTLKGLEMEPTAENPNILQCQVCNTLVINTSIHLHTHRFQHLPYKPYKCRHCFMILNNYSIALTHVLNQCQEDNKDHGKSKDSTVAIKTIKESFEISCSFCQNQKFSDFPSILQHFRDKHNNFLQFFCHQPDDTMICNICRHQIVVYDRNTCISHIIQHLDQKTYKCLLCPQSYHSNQECWSHLKKIHYAKAINTQKTIDKSQNNSQSQGGILNKFIKFINFACPECNESFANQQLWHDHINNKHNFFDIENLGVVDPLDGLLKCQHCQIKQNYNLLHQQNHKLTHMPYRSFICNLCYNRCTSLTALYGHLRRVHLSKGSFKCPMCPVVSNTSYERSEHINKTHLRSEWPATMCLVCYRTFYTKKELTNHMIKHNINQPTFECKYCSVQLFDMKDLKIHVAQHEKNMKQTGEFDENNDDDDNSKTPKIDNDGITDINSITNDAVQQQNINADDHKQIEGTVQNLFNNSTNTDTENLIENDKTNEILNTEAEIIKTSKSDNKDNKNMIKVEKRKLIIKAVKTENKSNAKRKKLK